MLIVSRLPSEVRYKQAVYRVTPFCIFVTLFTLFPNMTRAVYGTEVDCFCQLLRTMNPLRTLYFYSYGCQPLNNEHFPIYSPPGNFDGPVPTVKNISRTVYLDNHMVHIHIVSHLYSLLLK